MSDDFELGLHKARDAIAHWLQGDALWVEHIIDLDGTCDCEPANHEFEARYCEIWEKSYFRQQERQQAAEQRRLQEVAWAERKRQEVLERAKLDNIDERLLP